MTRKEAIRIVDELVKSENIRKHLIACEAVMRALAEKFEPEKSDDWGLVGLLHDADYEATNKSVGQHTELVTEKLKEISAPQEIIDAVRGHADKVQRSTLMAKAIYAADELTGLIVAATLVRPDKKLASLTVESVLKRFREPAFARGANRDMIATCENELDLPLLEFVNICLTAMQKINNQLGL